MNTDCKRQQLQLRRFAEGRRRVVGKADPTGSTRRCERDRAKGLAGKSTLHRLEGGIGTDDAQDVFGLARNIRLVGAMPQASAATGRRPA